MTITGNLGTVMKESATIALEYIKANSGVMGLNSEILNKYNIHLHVPEGATPKETASAKESKIKRELKQKFLVQSYSQKLMTFETSQVNLKSNKRQAKPILPTKPKQKEILIYRA